MKRTFLCTFFISLVTIFACQHELQWNLHSEGSLKKDSGGNCLPITVAGNFVRNKIITDSNFLIVSVDVAVKGEYVITSDSVNGYLFKASGVFNSTGNNLVKLSSSGKPIVAGIDHFGIHYSNSNCEAFVTVKPDTVAVANYTLQGSAGNCMDDSVFGYYIQTVPLDTSNKIIIKVDVIATGSYSIQTSTVNGYSFSAAGICSSTGIQTVKLLGSGVPTVAGNNSFKVAAGNDNCSFSVTVAAVVPVVNESYFPLTEGSNWTYDVGPVPGNSIMRNIKGDTMVNGLKYTKMNETSSSGTSLYLFNQNIYDYTEFGNADKYTLSFRYGSDVYGVFPFLKEHLVSGQSWESQEIRGVASFGQVIFIKYYYQCLNTNAAITINGQGFINTYIIAVYPQIRSENNSYGSTGEIYYYYYAKGVGLIHLEKKVNGLLNQYAMQIKTWHVN